MIEFARVAQYVGKCGELWGGNLTVIALLVCAIIAKTRLLHRKCQNLKLIPRLLGAYHVEIKAPHL